MNEKPETGVKKKTYYSDSDLRNWLDTLQKKIEECSTKEEIQSYLNVCMEELEKR